MTDEMTLAIVAGVFSLTGAAIGAAISFYIALLTLRGERAKLESEEVKLQSEEVRWHLNYYLPRSIEAISSLYAALVECYDSLNRYRRRHEISFETIDEAVEPKVSAFMRARAMAYIYLDEKANSTLTSSEHDFRLISSALTLAVLSDKQPSPDEHNPLQKVNEDWTKYKAAYEASVACLRERLNPALLEGLLTPTVSKSIGSNPHT